MKRPSELKNPDLTALKKVIKDYLDYIESDDFHEDNDYDHYIFEAAVEAFYDKEKVWDFVNDKLL